MEKNTTKSTSDYSSNSPKTIKPFFSNDSKDTFFSPHNFLGGGNFFQPTSLPIQTKSNVGLPKDVQFKMESTFGEDFSNVTIHENSKQAEDLNALAFTQGDNIHFAPGRFDTQSKSGQELVGHEFAHVAQQRQGRVNPTSQLKGMSINNDRGLEEEADVMGKKAAQAKFNENQTPLLKQSTSSSSEAGVKQFALPALIAAMGAADWLAAGALGYVLTNDATNAVSGDVSYSFDEVEGVLLPNGGSDVAEHKKAHPNAQIYEATHQLAIWTGLSDTRKMGIKFGITFLFDDAGAIGNISCSLLDVYDWPGWGGSLNVNFTSRSLTGGDGSFRITVNVNENNSWFVSDDSGSIVFLLRGGDGDLSNIAGTKYIHHKIG